MEWILVTGYTFLFIAIILRFPGFNLAEIPSKWLAGVFILKVISGISLGLIYTYYYTDRTTADTFKFFDDSRLIFNTLSTHPYDFFRMFTGIDGNAPELRKYYVEMDAWLNTDVMFNDNKTIIRLNVFFHFFSLGNYYVHVVFINFISFIGLLCIYKTFQRNLHTSSHLLFFATFFLPSVMFWGSGLLKDGLLLFALGLVLISFSQLLKQKNDVRTITLFTLSLILLIFTKLYVIIAIFPGLLAWYWASKDAGWKVWAKFSICYMIYFLIVFNIHLLLPQFNVADIIYWKQKNFNTLAALTQAKSIINIPQLETGVLSILINSPAAFLTTLTRPLLSDAHGNILTLVSALETTMILFLIVSAIWLRKKNIPPVTPAFVFSIFFVLLIFVLIGLITPILGALVRYKVPVLPFLLFILLSIVDRNRIVEFYDRFTKKKSTGIR